MVQLRPGDPPPPTLSLAAGLALIEAADVAVPGQSLSLKWPNDLMLLGKKLGGILLERSGERVAVGFGVNLETRPKLADRETASLGGIVPPEAFAPLLAGSFTRLLALWRGADPRALAQAWQERAHPLQTPLTVHLSADETISGRFAGLEHDGALRLMLDDGSVELVRAGDVQL